MISNVGEKFVVVYDDDRIPQLIIVLFLDSKWQAVSIFSRLKNMNNLLYTPNYTVKCFFHCPQVFFPLNAVSVINKWLVEFFYAVKRTNNIQEHSSFAFHRNCCQLHTGLCFSWDHHNKLSWWWSFETSVIKLRSELSLWSFRDFLGD